MKAAIRTQYGPPDLLSVEEIPMPQPKDNEVLVKVCAATVNRTDCGALWGKPYIFRFFVGWPKPRHASTGTDFAGTVEAVGKNVIDFKLGDRVWGFNDNNLGSHAQYFTMPANGPITHIPDGISCQHAAASAEGAHYALNFINKINLKPGHHVLVYGATGAIGSAAVQLVKYFGASVTAVCNTKNTERIKQLGADRVIDYETEDFTKDAQRYHFVFDAVGKSSFGQCKPLLVNGGIYISSELGPGNENLYLPITTLFSNKKVIFPVPLNIKKTLELMNKLLEERKFEPLMDRTYPIEKIAEAFTYVQSGQKTGNVLIDFGTGA